MLFFLFSYVLAFNNILPKIYSKYVKENKQYIKFRYYDTLNDNTINEYKVILEELKNELEELKNRNCGEVNEIYEIEELDRDYFKIIQILKKIDKNFKPDILLNKEELNKNIKPIFITNEWCS
jgi:hypothetical protein